MSGGGAGKARGAPAGFGPQLFGPQLFGPQAYGPQAYRPKCRAGLSSGPERPERARPVRLAAARDGRRPAARNCDPVER